MTPFFSLLVGLATVFVLALILSQTRRSINWRTVGIAFAIQVSIAGIGLYSSFGQIGLAGMVSGIQSIIAFGSAGIEFVFGSQTSETLGFTIALNVLPVIVFFSALMSVLYYLGVMQFVVSILGGGLRLALKTSNTESMSAISNVFVGHTEAPLVVRPYLATMTESELFAIMTGGTATIAGAVMAGYAAMGVDLSYLVVASFMAAPGGLLMAKLILPETQQPGTHQSSLEDQAPEEKPVNIFDAIADGSLIGLRVALNVGALLLAFVALIAMLNGLIGMVGGWFGFEGLTLQLMLGYILAPLAFLLGVPWEEATIAGSLIGQKFVINEFFAYVEFIAIKDTLSAHTQAIITFALCGFANLASIAILMGGLGALVPARRADVARLGLKAVLAGTLVNLTNAVLASFFLSLS